MNNLLQNTKRIFAIALMAGICFVATMAQADYTSSIQNPSFESDMTGWIHKGLGTQNNNIFNIKDGNIYLEKWTGRGGAVGSASVSQVLNNLPPGNYELTAAAQNIQEDTPTAEQTGAWIFAGDNKTAVTVRDTYTVAFTYVSGGITIGFEAVDASGNWISVDNFQLTLIDQNLTDELKTAIESAQTLYGNGTGNEAAQLLAAIQAAQTAANKTEVVGDEQAQAIIALENAVDIYRRANASEENPLDMTNDITNPSFENDGVAGWTDTNMATQGNNVFDIKQGNIYLEKWTGRGGAVGDAQVYQTLSNMRPGRYQLKAVAQNIQEDTPKAAQTGAWIYANMHQTSVTIRQDYTLDFVLVSDQLEIGFKAEGASGNWLAVDNFRLYYLSDNFDAIKAEYLSLITTAETLATQKTNTAAHNALQTAIDNANALKNQTSTEGWPMAARELEAVYHTAEASKLIFSRLATAISEAQAELNASQTANKETYQAAINAAQAVYDNDSTTDKAAEAAIITLADARFAFKVENGTGSVPTVTTDPRFIRGCNWAFGRSTVNGGNIIEEGFCWSEQPDPKVTDNRTTEYLNQAGKIYWIRDLKPATMYYMRAYAITKDYTVGYGDVIKFSTVPKGTVSHWYNNGGDEASNERINYAINLSMDYYWNNLTSIHGFGISVTFGSGTPTADCGYGGGMRVGPSSSYQQPGTIMHEAFHGIGVGTHSMWWNGEMRSAGNRGDWLGDRVTEAVRFWDNSTTAVITGDDMHLWPYGCNGAHEDTHNDNLYCMMGILAQALNEDGLPASGEIGYALPYYSFNHEDGVKYYIKNEDENRGLRSAYLVETSSHTLEWKTMTAEDAAADDHAAWYLSFTPSNQYYQLRNAATGYYMTYNSGIKTVNHSKATSADNFHLMRGRVNVDGYRGYYIIHPESSANPPVLVANANGKTGSGSFNIANSATTQRWLILTSDDALNFDNGNIVTARTELAEMLARIRKFAETPHTEDVEGTDATLNNTLTSIESQAETCTKGSEVSALTTQAWNAGLTFLSSVSASDMAQPFDLTFMLENPDFDNDAITGWKSSNGNPGYGGQAAEFYEKTFNYYQTLENMPAGTYELKAYAFQRPGPYGSVLVPYNNGTAKITSSLYINTTSTTIKHICDDRQPSALYTGDGYDQQLADNTYIPNTMTGASKYFAKGLYDNSAPADLTASGKLKVGIKCTSAPSNYWTMFDHFRLYFYGGNHTLTGIEEVENERMRYTENERGIYDLSGRRVSVPSVSSERSVLPKGVYIKNGKKIVVK